MGHKYQVSLISDSTGETLDRIFLALKSQFSNFDYEKKEYVFVRTERQIDKIIKENEKKKNLIILYTIVETKLAKYISHKCIKKKNPNFSILGNLILNFSKLLNQKATNTPSAQHVLDEDYYKRIEAIQFAMTHDDGMRAKDVKKADIILLGVSRTSKTPTSIYYSNLDFIQNEIKASNKLFKKYNWPVINVTRKSVEETAASIIRVFEIKKRA